MNCTQTQPLLDPYADHMLSAWQAFRVRRHLAGCAACTLQLADIQRLNASVHAWRDVSASAALEERIAATLPWTASAPTPPRDPHIVRRATVGLAGVAAATGAGFWLLPGKPSQPTLAYADVERAMEQVQVISFTTRVRSADATEHGSMRFSPGVVTWVRRDPPAIAVTTPTGADIILEDKHGVLGLAGHAYYIQKHSKDTTWIEKQVQDAFQVFTQPPVVRSSIYGKGVYDVVTKPQQRLVDLNGQKRILFTFSRKSVFHPGNSASGTSEHSYYSVWVDPATLLATRRETRFREESTDTRSSLTQTTTRTTVDDGFHYNQIPPPGVFEWSPPVGAKVIVHK